MSASRVKFVAAALALLAAAAGAADATKAHAYATRDQLRECMELEAALKIRFHDMASANAANDATGDGLAAEAAKVHETQARLDRGDAAAVTAFKQSVATYNERVAAWKKATADVETANDAYKADSAAVDQKCVGLAYHPQDIDAVMKERKKAAAAASAATP
jgi:hypothetical protein